MTTTKVNITCRFCSKDQQIEVPAEGYWKWKRDRRVSIQEAMPKVDVDTRECLISNICLKCVKRIFNGGSNETT